MPLRSCMQAHTHREYLAWQAWLDEQWNHPNRTDQYLIQIAVEIYRIWCVLAGKKGQVNFKDFKLKFGPPPRPKTKEEATLWAKARWGAMLSSVMPANHPNRIQTPGKRKRAR